MRVRLFGLAAFAGCALCVESAWGAWGFKYEFLDTNSGLWTSSATATVQGGSTVQFRVKAYVDPNTIIAAVNGPGQAVAFCRLTAQEKMTNFGSVAGDTVVTSLAGTNEGTISSHTSYLSTSVSGTTTLFGTTSATSFAAQLLLSGSLGQFCPSNPVPGVPKYEWVVRHGSIALGGPPGVRAITFSKSVRTQTLWYRDLYNASTFSQDVNTGTPAGAPIGLRGSGALEEIPATDIEGTVVVTILDVPTPGTLAGLWLVSLGAIRRRR